VVYRINFEGFKERTAKNAFAQRLVREGRKVREVVNILEKT